MIFSPLCIKRCGVLVRHRNVVPAGCTWSLRDVLTKIFMRFCPHSFTLYSHLMCVEDNNLQRAGRDRTERVCVTRIVFRGLCDLVSHTHTVQRKSGESNTKLIKKYPLTALQPQCRMSMLGLMPNLLC